MAVTPSFLFCVMRLMGLKFHAGLLYEKYSFIIVFDKWNRDTAAATMAAHIDTIKRHWKHNGGTLVKTKQKRSR